MKHCSKKKTISASRARTAAQVTTQGNDLGLQKGKVHATEEVGEDSRGIVAGEAWKSRAFVRVLIMHDFCS